MAARTLFVAVMLCGSALLARAQGPLQGSRKVDLNLQLKDLTQPLQNLNASDQQSVDQAIRAIGQQDHVVALSYLTKLSASNPMNSSLRVLRAFVLLEVGNVAGALSEAKTAEKMGGHSAYRCWFLAQVAYAAGNTPLCRREVRHLAGNPTYGASADKLSLQLASDKKR